MKTLRLNLNADEHWHLLDAGAWRIRCESGQLWVSCQGDVRDHILLPGEELELRECRGVLLGALAESSLSIEAPSLEVPARSWHRLAELLWLIPAGARLVPQTVSRRKHAQC